MNITPRTKKYVSVGSMVVLATNSIPAFQSLMPAWLNNGIITISAYLVLLSAYWVFNSETE